MGVDDGLDILGGLGQRAAPQGFHHHQGHAALFGQLNALHARLMMDVQIVVLDLGHHPVVAVDNVLKYGIFVVEGEAGILDAPVLDGGIQKFQGAQGLHLFPAILAQGVQQIKVHIGDLELFQLLVQQPVHILAGLHRPAGQLGGQLHALAVAVPQGFAHHQLALTAVIRIGGVHIVDAAVDARADQLDGPGHVDGGFAVLPGHGGKTHAAKAQTGNVKTQGTERYILHKMAASL